MSQQVSTHDLIRQLAEEVRLGGALSAEEHAIEDYGAGVLAPAEEQALLDRAQSDPELARALGAYQPLSVPTQERFVEAVQNQLERERASAQRALNRVAPRDAHRVASPHKALSRLSWTLPALAFAAGAVLLIGRQGPHNSAPDAVATTERAELGGALGLYQLQVRGGVATDRGDPGKVATFSATRPPQFILRPASSSPVTPKVAVYAGTTLTGPALPATLEAQNGTLRVTLTGDTLQSIEESGTLSFVIFTTESAAKLAQTSAPAETQGPGWQRLTAQYRRLPPTP
jgi:hypothetical protein